MHPEIVAIGGSLGGVDAVAGLCQALPGDFPAAVCVVLHVGAKGNNLLADVFDARSSLRVKTAADGELVRCGNVYIAPADHHLLVVDGRVRLGRGPRENMARPSIDPLLRSVGASYGPRAIGVVLTGLLNDGASGLADLKSCGGVTVVQNPRDALAADMPLGALRTGDVDYRASLDEMPALLLDLVRREAGPAPPIPKDLLLEIDIALGTSTGAEAIRSIADPVALSCPACQGVLSRMHRSPPLRYRCQVGHAYTADSLVATQEGSVDEAMRLALRVLEERAVLSGQMAEEARRSGRLAAAQISDDAAARSREAAEVLRNAVLAREFDSP